MEVLTICDFRFKNSWVYVILLLSYLHQSYPVLGNQLANLMLLFYPTQLPDFFSEIIGYFKHTHVGSIFTSVG